MSADVLAPPRPDRPAPAPRRRFLPVAVLAAVVAVVAFGGYIVAAILETPQGPPAGFPDIVTVQPLSGWTVERELDEGLPLIRLTRGNGTLDVHVTLQADGPASLAQTYVDAVLTNELSGVRVSDRLQRVELAGGVLAVRFQYLGTLGGSGTAVEGQVTAAVTTSGDGVVFDGRAPQGLLPFVSEDLDTMIARAKVGP